MKQPLASVVTLLSCCACLILGGAVLAQAQTPAFKTGQIIEKVACLADASQSYALYLPSNYSPDKSWPILYGFDPGARGKQPVELYHDTAEKFGWIVVGSHNSRNGPGVPLSDILNALWRDTHERLAIDDRRVYATGMSGGARVAARLGLVLKDQLAGLILCGAGFPYEHSPSKELRFAVFSSAGLEDFNLIELHELETALAKAGITHQLLMHDGGHTWPPQTVLAEGIEWMEIQAMKAGVRARDDGLIASLYAQAVARARRFTEANQPYDAAARYEMIATSFSGLRDVAEVAALAQRLKETKEVQAALNQLKQTDRMQQMRGQEFITALQAINNDEERVMGLSSAKRLAGQMRKQAADSQSSSERIVARRLLGQFSISASEQANDALFRKEYRRAAAFLSVAAEIRSDNPQLWLRLAMAYAQGGDKKPALEALKHAVAHGFTDAARLEQEPALTSLRQEKEFKALIEQVKAK